MKNANHLIKVSAAWTTIVYIICYVGVAAYPPVRELFMRYALHASMPMSFDYLGPEYFLSGLIIWNILAIAGAWLFAFLFNTIKE